MAKSIIEIEVKDGAFKSFARQIDAHQEKLKTMPGQWGAVGKSISAVSGAAAKFSARIEVTANAIQKSETRAGKLALTLKAADRTLSSMARGSSAFLRNIKESTSSILSWLPIMGLVSGVLGAGGLFGMARLASSAAQGSQEAKGLGSSYGKTKSAAIAYQGMGSEADVKALQAQIMESKFGTGEFLMRLGMERKDFEGKDTADLLAPVLKAIQERFKEAPAGEAGKAQAMEQFAPGVSMDKILRIVKMNVGALEKEYKGKAEELELSAGEQDAWSKFNLYLGYFNEKFENIFHHALSGEVLTSLQKFGSAIIKATDTIVNSKFFKGLISGAAKGLESFSGYLTDGRFENDFTKFAERMEAIANALAYIADAIGDWFGSKEDDRIKRQQALQETQDKFNKSAAPTAHGDKPAQIAKVTGAAKTEGQMKYETTRASSTLGGVTVNKLHQSPVNVKIDVYNSTHNNINARLRAAGN
jgi:hypothetical protein